MGKGYNNYMTKKPFHPGSKANIKRTWMAEQRAENEQRKQDELKVQYEKEQDLYNNRALLSTESKDKLELNFMYEAPPGAKRERQKEDDEPEYKFEWQRKYNAPREDYAKGNADIRDQPFGIPVRNVKCIKCHKWGHINTDRECPLFSQASTSSMPTTSMDPLELMRQMREDGYHLKQSALGRCMNSKQSNQQLLPSDESDPEMEFLRTLSSDQKKKLLKKLNKLSKKQKKKEASKKKKSKKAKKSSKKEESSSSESDSSESDAEPHHGKKSKLKRSKSPDANTHHKRHNLDANKIMESGRRTKADESHRSRQEHREISKSSKREEDTESKTHKSTKSSNGSHSHKKHRENKDGSHSRYHHRDDDGHYSEKKKRHTHETKKHRSHS